MNAWEEEPDKRLYRCRETGYMCIILRHSAYKHLCGYLSVDSRLFENSEHVRDIHLSVHGGITFIADTPPVTEVQALPEITWIGFDCAHYGDLQPNGFQYPGAVYRNWSFVEKELLNLALQVRDLKE